MGAPADGAAASEQAVASTAASRGAGSAVIAEPRIQLSRAPSDAAGKIVALDPGTPVCVFGRTTDADGKSQWLAVQLASSTTGFVRAEAVSFASSPAMPSCQRSSNGGGSNGLSRIPSDSPLLSLQPIKLAGFLPLKPLGFSFSVDFGAMMFKRDVAMTQQISSPAFESGVTSELSFYDVFTMGLALALAVPSDNGSFSEQVMPVGGGDVTTASSTVAVGRYAFQLGVHTPFLALRKDRLGYVAAALFADLGWAGITGGRAIPNCIDCDKQDLRLSGGMYWRVGAELMLPSKHLRGWGIVAGYQAYTGDASLSGELIVNLNVWL